MWFFLFFPILFSSPIFFQFYRTNGLSLNPIEASILHSTQRLPHKENKMNE